MGPRFETSKGVFFILSNLNFILLYWLMNNPKQYLAKSEQFAVYPLYISLNK